MMMYDISGFDDWLNPVPDDLGIDELYVDEEFGNSAVRRCLRPDAPPYAVKAFARYIEALREAKKRNAML